MRVKRGLLAAQKKSQTKPMVDSAVALAALTALVYATAVSYEGGYCRYFGIPRTLIIPSTSVIVTALLTVVFVVGFIAAPFMGLPRLILQHISLPVGFRIRVEMSIWFSLGALLTFGFSWSALAAAAFFFFAICSRDIPAFFPGRKPLLQRIHDVDAEPDHLNEASPLTGLFKLIGPVATGFGVLMLLAVMAAGAVGTATARLQKDFDVLEARPDVALIRAYGDLMVGIKFDEGKKVTTGEVVVFKVDHDFRQLNIRSRRIGPLTGEDRPFLDFKE